MNMKDKPNRVTMHCLNKSIYILIFVLLSLSSPGDCDCVFKGKEKSLAVCTDIFPEISFFKSNIYHLDIQHTFAHPVFQLSSSHFAGNPSLAYVEYIRIHNTTLVSVGKNAFSGLAYLNDLDISDNSLLKSFHKESVSEVKSLTILSLSGNIHLFNHISGPILISDSLEELDLSRCDIEYLHNDAFNQLKQLTYLNLASNKISKIPSSTFCSLHQLVELDLSENLLSNLPWFMLQNSSAVEVLKLRGNPISDIPKDIFHNSGYQVFQLDLSETEMTTISIPPLQSLVYLNLGGSLVSSLKNFSDFPDLTHLNLSYTKITTVDSVSFEHNPRLETIRLSGNTNLSLPHRFIGSLWYVELMDISNCDLVYLMPDIFEEMKSIVTLNLSCNAFNNSESLGRALRPLQRLEVLDLSHNKLRVLGEGDLSGNSGLKKLLLSGNPLMSPPSLTSTSFLNYLDLSRCTLTRLHLPAIFRQTPNLRYLSLSSNNLISLNDEAYLGPFEDEDSPWSLPGPLWVLDLSDNPWSCDPSFISLIYEVSKRGVAPSTEPPQRTRPSEGGLRDVDKEWERLVDRACERAHYDVAITLKPLNLPPALEGTVTAKFPIWLTLGILVAIILASAIILYKLFQRHASHLQQPKGFIPPMKSEGVKISVALVNTAGGMKMAGRTKDYQRLQEDRSPGSPETPRIYRPPPNGGHFRFPNIPDGKDPESCD